MAGRNGSPPLPKMLSTKSRLLTRLPGAKNRTSIDRANVTFGTAGTTTGRSRSDTNDRAWSGWSAVNGTASSSAGGRMAAWNSSANVRLGTANLSNGTGSPPSTTWNVPWVVRRSLLGLCRTPLRRR